jgi:hypothetical protein
VSLGRYAVYASLLVGGEVTPWASARTLPPPPALRAAAEVRDRSRRRWGTGTDVIEAQLEALAVGRLRHDAPTEIATPNETFGLNRDSDDKETAS